MDSNKREMKNEDEVLTSEEVMDIVDGLDKIGIPDPELREFKMVFETVKGKEGRSEEVEVSDEEHLQKERSFAIKHRTSRGERISALEITMSLYGEERSNDMNLLKINAKIALKDSSVIRMKTDGPMVPTEFVVDRNGYNWRGVERRFLEILGEEGLVVKTIMRLYEEYLVVMEWKRNQLVAIDALPQNEVDDVISVEKKYASELKRQEGRDRGGFRRGSVLKSWWDRTSSWTPVPKKAEDEDDLIDGILESEVMFGSTKKVSNKFGKAFKETKKSLEEIAEVLVELKGSDSSPFSAFEGESLDPPF